MVLVIIIKVIMSTIIIFRSIITWFESLLFLLLFLDLLAPPPLGNGIVPFPPVLPDNKLFILPVLHVVVEIQINSIIIIITFIIITVLNRNKLFFLESRSWHLTKVEKVL